MKRILLIATMLAGICNQSLLFSASCSEVSFHPNPGNGQFHCIKNIYGLGTSNKPCLAICTKSKEFAQTISFHPSGTKWLIMHALASNEDTAKKLRTAFSADAMTDEHLSTIFNADANALEGFLEDRIQDAKVQLDNSAVINLIRYNPEKQLPLLLVQKSRVETNAHLPAAHKKLPVILNLLRFSKESVPTQQVQENYPVNGFGKTADLIMDFIKERPTKQESFIMIDIAQFTKASE